MNYRAVLLHFFVLDLIMGNSTPPPAPQVVEKPDIKEKPVLASASDLEQQIRDEILKVTVDKAELEMAQHALCHTKTKTFQSIVANDKFMGVYKEDLDKFGYLLCNKLNWKTSELRKKVTDCLTRRSLVDGSQVTSYKMDEFHFDVTAFNFLNGFIVGRKRPGTNKLDIRYAISRLMFSVQDKNAFSPDQVAAIKNHYGKNEALKSLQQENVIAEITYV